MPQAGGRPHVGCRWKSRTGLNCNVQYRSPFAEWACAWSTSGATRCRAPRGFVCLEQRLLVRSRQMPGGAASRSWEREPGILVRRRRLDDSPVQLGQENPGIPGDAFPPCTRNLVLLGIAWHGDALWHGDSSCSTSRLNPRRSDDHACRGGDRVPILHATLISCASSRRARRKNRRPINSEVTGL